MQKKKHRKVNFRIGHCSSQDPDYPATQLLYQSSDAKGWQCKRFPTYPQIIILQLAQPTLLKQISLLSHQSKIASRVQIQAKIDDSKDYKKLGYVSLTSNENTNFQARQLRTANINGVPASLIKLTLRTNHINSQNVFNQVGLISLSIYGDPITQSGFSSIGNSNSNSAISKDKFPSLQFDQQTLLKLKELEIRKKQAVENEEFDVAKKIKDQIQMIKNIGQTLILLQQKKQQAIKNQDYQNAKIINEKMKKMRDENGWGPNTSTKPSGSSAQYYKQQQRNQKYQDQVLQSAVSPVSQNKPKTMQKPRQQIIPPRKQQTYVKKQRPLHNEDRPIQGQDRPLDIKGKQGPSQFPQDQMREGGELQPLSKQLLGECQQYFSVFDEQVFRHIFSKDHKNRQNGMMMIKQSLNDRPADKETFIEAVLFAVKNCIDDRIASVLIVTLEVFGQFMRKVKPQANSNNLTYAEYILEKMADYLGHTNEKIKNISDSVYCNLPVYHLTNKDICYKNLTILYKRDKPPKILAGKLKMIAKIVSQYQLGKDYQGIIEYAVKYIDDKNNDVRNGAISVVCAISNEIGYSTVQPFLKNVRPQIIKSIEEQIDGSGQVDNRNFDDKPIKTNNKTSNNNTKKPQQKNELQSVQNEFIEIPKGGNQNSDFICPFCKRFDQRFAEEDFLDMHYFHACPMLTICLECKQTIEVSYLTAHLVGECQNSKYYKRCPRCKQAVLQKNYKVHVQKKQCLSAKPMAAANRCPLCHLDIQSGVDGWRQHLVEEGCENSPRK